MVGRTVEGGVEIGLRVSPGARCDRIQGRYGDRLKVQVRAPPEDGKANRALRRFFATKLGRTLDEITVVHGETSRDKRIRIDGMSLDEVASALGLD